MDGTSILLLSVLLGLLVLSACFSATETAFLSLNRIKLKNMAANGNKKAASTLALAEKQDTLLPTILIGNNIVNISAASLATVFFTRFFGDIGVTVATIVMTILVLIFGEISPKTIAKENPDSFAMFITPFIRVVRILFTPFNFLFTLWKKMLLKLFHHDCSPSITEEELITIVEEAEQDGGIDEHEKDLIRSAIEFNDVSVDEILTPRVDIVALEKDSTLKKIAETFASTGYSRLPIYEDTIDNIIGILHEKDFYTVITAKSNDIFEVMNKPVCISGHMKISNLLKLLQISQTHLVVVMDDYGGTQGIVTMEDVIEELVGDIWDEHDEMVELIHKEGENSFTVSCGAKWEDLCDVLGWESTEEEENAAPTTVNGWIMQKFGRIPAVGDTLQYHGLEIIVTKAERKRVIEIKIICKVTAEEGTLAEDEKELVGNAKVAG